MDQVLNEIRIAYQDVGINNDLATCQEQAEAPLYSIHFNQAEELFIKTAEPLFVPRLPIHHDIKRQTPDAPYIRSVADVVRQLCKMLPNCMAGLSYFFDPGEILKPCFYHLYKLEDNIYLYLLRLDLEPRHLEIEVLQAGSNDITPAYSTKHLYLESELIPLEAVMWENGRVRAFVLKQLISQTWIGETGKGYFVRGIWMDSDLSKFFTRLFLPSGKRIYPFFPLFCKYRTVCAAAPVLTGSGRRHLLPALHHSVKLLLPEMHQIQETLRSAKFAEDLPIYQKLREQLPERWRHYFNCFSMESYLNENEHKEYLLHHEHKPSV
ncbi:MAG: hypothetical protein A2087_08590 [Spirochaetes bacterium GWD1_61_31]|nr:MAG: hypothetical protein A2Y37_13225 [Spirochaetes bacterium GWB1_60_80]OHD35486.1 MAG: hypothetical protein A2004_08540 [Spirochaetes bacterium GWC1_61_12]OHD36728.1 MAG: hypothetical protein A2087_08590 [Spirochaetes bacterium GWD1_61_31]OHD42514.1 MAG: hypothetical protein A2Y35_08020 [Spirochaetes bacterium GWE1_60_18]OHD58242.1 MAG: hypothetical protein A2Y32_04940 [Spirochaetes bacterium GWF1_60_12]HAP44300.1 hypothetical protein [Spirochaetaceae bacterium]